MKIKIVYGVDMRLWKHAPFDDKPQPQTFQDLITYIVKTFEFKDVTQFLIKFKDDDDELTTISSLQDFQDAYISYKEQEKKSLKLHIHDKASNMNPSAQAQQQQNEADEEEKKSVAPDTPNQGPDEPPIESRYASSEKEGNGDNVGNAKEPSPEEINAFLSDDFVIDLLSDLFVSVFEALQESQFEISFIECVQGIILSDDGKYDKLTSDKIWPFFCDHLLPKYSSKIEMFVIPMIRNNNNFNSQMIKQWIPTMLNMMKMHQQRRMDNNNFGGFGAGFGGFPWRGMHGMHGQGRRGRGHGGRGRGGHGWRGRGWRNHHGHNHHGHHGWRGRGGRRGWRGHHGHHHGHGHGHNAWFDQQHQNQDNNNGSSEQELAPSAPVMEGVNVNVNDENEQMEQEQFEYTEELVAIMNMGFTNIIKIKKLLNEHKGNKQTVVQELVSSKN